MLAVDSTRCGDCSVMRCLASLGSEAVKKEGAEKLLYLQEHHVQFVLGRWLEKRVESIIPLVSKSLAWH